MKQKLAVFVIGSLALSSVASASQLSFNESFDLSSLKQCNGQGSAGHKPSTLSAALTMRARGSLQIDPQLLVTSEDESVSTSWKDENTLDCFHRVMIRLGTSQMQISNDKTGDAIKSDAWITAGEAGEIFGVAEIQLKSNYHEDARHDGLPSLPPLPGSDSFRCLDNQETPAQVTLPLYPATVKYVFQSDSIQGAMGAVNISRLKGDKGSLGNVTLKKNDAGKYDVVSFELASQPVLSIAGEVFKFQDLDMGECGAVSRNVKLDVAQ